MSISLAVTKRNKQQSSDWINYPTLGFPISIPNEDKHILQCNLQGSCLPPANEFNGTTRSDNYRRSFQRMCFAVRRVLCWRWYVMSVVDRIASEKLSIDNLTTFGDWTRHRSYTASIEKASVVMQDQMEIGKSNGPSHLLDRICHSLQRRLSFAYIFA